MPPVDISVFNRAANSQYGPDLRTILTLAELQQRMQLLNQEQQGQNALKQIFSNPGNVDERGLLKPEATRQLMSTAPRVGMEYQQNALRALDQQARTAFNRSKAGQALYEQGLDIAKRMDAEFTKLSETMPHEQARQTVERDILEPWRNQLAQSGMYAPETMRDIPMNFDPARTRRLVEADRVANAPQANPTKFTVRTDYGKTPPVEYREYDTGKTTDRAGNPYTPTGIGEPKAAETEFFEGKVGDKTTGLLTRSPTGGLIDEKGNPVTGITSLHKVGTKPETNPASDEALTASAEMIAAYRQAPPSPYRIGTGSGPELMKRVKEINPNYNAQKYQVAQRLRNEFATGARTAKSMDAMNTLVHHIRVFDDVANGLNNRDTNAINRVMNYVQSELGRPQVTNFEVAKGIIADEVINAVVGSGAVFDRERMQKELNNARSPEQFRGISNEIRRLMGGRMGSFYQRWKSGDLPDDEFVAKLEPETIEGIRDFAPKNLKEALGGGGEPASSGAAPQKAPQGEVRTDSGMRIYQP